MIIKIGMGEIVKKTIVFQRKGYMGNKIYEYIVGHKGIMPIEIFPGIFLSLEEERRIEKIAKRFTKKDYRNVVFDVQNMRDRFEIIDSKDECGEFSSPKLITKVEEISPEKISYPNDLEGGECKECKVAYYFSELSLTGTYSIINDADVLEQTKFDPYFINMCKSSRCYQNYLKIEKEGYKTDLPESEMIQIDVEKGRFIPVEGKHRVCAMKRYDYTQRIPVRITYGEDRESGSYLMVSYSPLDNDLKKYYKCYEKYGLSRDDVLNYLSDQSKSLCKMIIEKDIRESEARF